MSADPHTAASDLAAIDVQGHTRQAFILRSALAAGSVYGLGAVGPFVREAVAQSGEDGPVEVLNFALTLEYLEAAFYERALERVPSLSGEVKDIATTLRDDEQEHVDTLAKTIKDLGGAPVKAPKVDFADAFKSKDAFLKLAQTLEDTGVRAYNGAAPALQNESKLLAAAGSIVQVEGRHAAAIRQLNGNPITDGAFDTGLARQMVLDRVQPFIMS